MKKAIGVLIIALISFSSVFSQEKLSGRIHDAETGEPLPFVNIIFNHYKEGCISDLDGYFEIPNKQRAEFLQCTFVGYQLTRIGVPENSDFIRVNMKPEALTLGEVTVLPGENPAHRIVNNAIDNKDFHDPDKKESYEFVSYSKMFFTFDADSLSAGLERDSLGQITDTSGRDSFVEFLEQHHLFLMESVTEKKFKSPDKASEKVLASRVSGLKHPGFTYLASEYQSFSFYGEYIEVAEQEYISPLCKNAPKKYLFLLKDTAYSQNGDTTFIMSFRPRKGTNFKGLKGLIYINSDGWAIQNVIAEPMEQSGLTMKIQQQYNKPDGKHWFPFQLNTDFFMDMSEFVEVSVDSSSNQQTVGLLGVGKTYVNEVVINGEINERLRGGNEVRYEHDATERDSLYWARYRVQALDDREKNTYNLIDSIGDELNLDEKLTALEILMTGKIPYGIINFDLNKSLWYNKYEGTRLGLAIETNERMSRHISLNAFGAYGIGDEEFKYGGGLKISPFGNDRFSLNAAWTHDIRETDAYNFGQARLFSSESFREFFIMNYDLYESWSASIDAKIFRGFYVHSYLDLNSIHYNDEFRYPHQSFLPENGWEAGLELKWIIREDIVRTPKGNIMSMGSKYPDLHLNLRHGFPWHDQNFNEYWRLEARFHDVIQTKWAGDFHLTIDGGYLFSDEMVYGQNFFMHSSGKWLDSDNTFATMQPGEFMADRFVSVFFKYDIGSLLFHVKNWKPEFALVTNAVIGDFSHAGDWAIMSAFPNKPMIPEQGYVESGLQINALMKQFFIKYGVGFYYHYGPYSGNAFKDNYAVKLRLVYEM